MSQSADAWFACLVETVGTLRSPGGCPWDREQTFESLRSFVLEEAYEVLDAIERRDYAELKGEIGDFVFEGVLLAQLAAEAGHFTIADSLQAIVEKLVRRHPHVFGGAERARTADEVLGRWEEAKARERGAAANGQTALSGIPPRLPALLTSFEMGTRAAAVGFDWERPSDVLGKIEEEVGELRRSVTGGESGGRTEEEMGDLLFAIANLSRKLGIEPEAALRRANAKFSRRFTELERRFADRGLSLHQTDLDTMEREWSAIKDTEAP
jgi:ATP diphosphatase